VSATLFNDIRGNRIPLSVAVTSNCEEASGVVVPIPT